MERSFLATEARKSENYILYGTKISIANNGDFFWLSAILKDDFFNKFNTIENFIKWQCMAI